jgi:hypothetical protein
MPFDPHKATHTAVAIAEPEKVLGELTVRATRSQLRMLLEWADRLDGNGRIWAVKAAGVQSPPDQERRYTDQESERAVLAGCIPVPNQSTSWPATSKATISTTSVNSEKTQTRSPTPGGSRSLPR